MKEIGSEFWDAYNPETKVKKNNVEYLISGRTALDYILKDIQADKIIKTAMLPSYCCDSMIEPFVRNNISVLFYEVNSTGICYPFYTKCDLVLVLDYFGYESKEIEVIAKRENKAGKIVIYDSTHKLNGNPNVERWAHYSFCSYRKWCYSNYAEAVKHNGAFVYKKKEGFFEEYISLRDKAVSMKAQNMNGDFVDKSMFLSAFFRADELLERQYEDYAGIPVAIPIQDIIKKRRNNAAYLIKRLSSCRHINVWKKAVGSEDSPLFVPILVPKKARAELKEHLISRNIFCPVHWPKTSLQIMDSDLYDEELSLVCDQRYTLSDMERIALEVEKFFNK